MSGGREREKRDKEVGERRETRSRSRRGRGEGENSVWPWPFPVPTQRSSSIQTKRQNVITYPATWNQLITTSLPHVSPHLFSLFSVLGILITLNMVAYTFVED